MVDIFASKLVFPSAYIIAQDIVKMSINIRTLRLRLRYGQLIGNQTSSQSFVWCPHPPFNKVIFRPFCLLLGPLDGEPPPLFSRKEKGKEGDWVNPERWWFCHGNGYGYGLDPFPSGSDRYLSSHPPAPPTPLSLPSPSPSPLMRPSRHPHLYLIPRCHCPLYCSVPFFPIPFFSLQDH